MLTIEGLCERPGSYRQEDIARLPGQVSVATRVPGREGDAVELRTLLEAVGAPAVEDAGFLLFESSDGFSACVARQGLDEALLIHGRDGAPLAAEAGGPFRFVIPASGACGSSDHDHCANVKSLKSIRVLAERAPDSRCA